MPSRLQTIVRRLVRSRYGATAIEYALVVALIATASIAAFGAVGQGMQNVLAVASNAMG